MANKVVYNNTSYDILNAITLVNRDYLIMVDSNDMNNITFLEGSIVDGQKKYSLPPKNFDISNKPNCDLKRLEANFIISKIVSALKIEISDGKFKDLRELKNQIDEIKKFIDDDININALLEDNKNLNSETFSNFLDYIDKYLDKEFSKLRTKDMKEQYSYMDRPIKTNTGLDYEWIYDLSFDQLKELAGNKNKTSEELIYILDALEKKDKTERAINNYTEMGKVKTLVKKDNKAAFIDIFLLSLITCSFGVLLLLSIF